MRTLGGLKLSLLFLGDLVRKLTGSGDCNGEKWETEYVANPDNDDEQIELEEKKERRHPCSCGSPKNSSESYEEPPSPYDSFYTVVSNEVAHDPRDNFDRKGISMEPDRTIGLNKSDGYKKLIASSSVTLDHGPLCSNKLIYPFLVVEAKRELDSPGFRAIERQTAFPIRRFLRAQYDLYTACKIEAHPLVWFFASSGNEWKVYGGIFNGINFRVFQLWMGTIESEDNAIQIIQIANFIWSWARNIYRPQIRRCLDSLGSGTRYTSRSSTEPLDRPYSVFSELNLRSFQKLLLEAVGKDRLSEKLRSEDALSDSNTKFHAFRKWEAVFKRSTPSNFDLCLRHSDLVSFSFQVLEIPRSSTRYHKFMISLPGRKARGAFSALINDDRHTLSLTKDRIARMENLWSGKSSYRNGKIDLQKIFNAFVFFRTYCHPTRWRIKRELCCIIWPLEVAEYERDSDDKHCHFSRDALKDLPRSDMEKAIEELRGIGGGHSIEYALKNKILNLSLRNGHTAIWRRPSDSKSLGPRMDMYLQIFDSTSDMYDAFPLYQSVNLAVVNPTVRRLPETLQSKSDDFDNSAVRLRWKSKDAPRACPKFCLFVNYREEIDEDLLKKFRNDVEELAKANPKLIDDLPPLVW